MAEGFSRNFEADERVPDLTPDRPDTVRRSWLPERAHPDKDVPASELEAAVAPEPAGRAGAAGLAEEPARPCPSQPASDPAEAKELSPAPLAPAPAPLAPATARAAAPAKAKRRWLRSTLFALLPVALAFGAYEYVTGGQIMSTDNAYVQAQSLGVSTDVSGTVSEVLVHDNEAVKKGQVLFRLRGDSFRIALEGAQAQLGTVRNQVLTLAASYKQSLAQIAQAKADLPFYETAFKRQQDLIRTAVASKATFDQAEHDLTAARQRIVVAEAQAASMLAQLGGDPDQPVEQNPFYLQAKSMVDNAQRDLNDTIVKAPFDGVVTNVDSLQVGGYLKASQPGFNLVSASNLWIEASPKETELTNVVPGQPVGITVDTYPGVTWRGSVESISPASSASFSLLPAQNTTGNWVKVVQRIPMRVRLDLDPGVKPPLRAGMSVVVDVDTGRARGLPEFAQHWLDAARSRGWTERAQHWYEQARQKLDGALARV